MEFKIHLPNAVKLFLILFLLFWIFTWDLPTDSDLSCEEPCTSCKENVFSDVSNSRSDVISIKDKSFDAMTYEAKKLDKSISTSSILIQSFKEWREMEMANHEKNFRKGRALHQNRKLIRRKLNYASSKCGAKILASNPEARHRMAVLSEKSYEYFLNPCRVTTWFVIELCDAVEVTQVELANYELYSSSPKEFLVFLSEVYPTLQWHHLGTFVAEDKRSMQTFNVNGSNMGKFIKVIIHSHHGKEHYCPLSAIRVLGYSMAQTLEDTENDENNIDADSRIPIEVNSVKTSPFKTVLQNTIKKKYNNTFMKTVCRNCICAELFKHCTKVSNINNNYSCLNKPTCRFLGEIVKISKITCLECYCPIHPPSLLVNLSSMEKLQTDPLNQMLLETEKINSNFYDYLDEKDIIKDYEHKKSLRIKEERKVHISANLKNNRESSNNLMKRCCNIDKIKNNKNGIILDSDKLKHINDEIKQLSKANCVLCDKDEKEIEMLKETKVTTKENFAQEQKENGEDIDSAGLINKDSVLFKLAAKIKTSERDLNFINKYLQQLSQSYRHQIEDMKARLNKTFQTMTETSRKTTEVNEKQEQSIILLRGKMRALNENINFLMKGKSELTKRVIELHGFFLILEIIIVATVFNIFLNIYIKKNRLYENRSVE